MTTEPAPITRPWLPTKLARLDALGSLEDGWAERGSLAPSPIAIQGARALVNLLSAWTVLDPALAPQIVPTLEGGIQIEWHEKGFDLEIEVTGAGTFEGWFARAADRSAAVSWGPEFEAEAARARLSADTTEVP